MLRARVIHVALPRVGTRARRVKNSIFDVRGGRGSGSGSRSDRCATYTGLGVDRHAYAYACAYAYAYAYAATPRGCCDPSGWCRWYEWDPRYRLWCVVDVGSRVSWVRSRGDIRVWGWRSWSWRDIRVRCRPGPRDGLWSVVDCRGWSNWSSDGDASWAHVRLQQATGGANPRGETRSPCPSTQTHPRASVAVRDGETVGA